MFPILFKLGPLTLYSYGLLVALGVLAGMTVIDKEAERQGWNRDWMSKTALMTFLMGLIGARITYVITRIGHEPVLPLIFDPHAGFVFYGGLIASWLWIWWRSKKAGYKVWSVMDAYALGICVGEGIGRFGCLLGGCCYGRRTDLFFGVVMRDNAHLGHLHPVQAYEGLLLLVFFAVLWKTRLKNTYSGESVVKFVGGYAVIRYFTELFRGDAVRGFVIDEWLSTSQMISLVMAAVVLALHLKLSNKKKAKA